MSDDPLPENLEKRVVPPLDELTRKIVAPDDKLTRNIQKSLQEWKERIDECNKKGHLELVDLWCYVSGSKTVTQHCTSCGGFKERSVTAEEQQGYIDSLNSYVP
jgi:hypothetical protein